MNVSSTMGAPFAAQPAILRILKEIAVLDTDLSGAMRVMVARACELTGAERGAIVTVQGSELVCDASAGSNALPEGTRLPLANSMIQRALERRAAQYCEDTQIDPAINREFTLHRGTRSVIVVPVAVGDHVICGLSVASDRPHAFGPQDVVNLQVLVESYGAIIQRHRLSGQLQASESQYRLLFAQNPHPMWVYDTQGLKLLAANQAMEALYGYTVPELLGMTLRDLWFDEFDKREDIVRSIPPGERAYNITRRHRRKDGSPIEVDISASPILFGGQEGRLVLATDVTQRSRAERELARTSRAQRMLSACNEAMIRATGQDALLTEICRITVDIGGYLGAWVGFALHDEARSIERVAFAGVLPGHILEPAWKGSWSDMDPMGLGPAGRTIRSGEPVIVEDVAQVTDANPGWGQLRAGGVGGLVTLPLRQDGHTFGLIYLSAGEAIQVSPDEVGLLQSLANNLAFGIGNLRAQQESRRDVQARLEILRIQQDIAALNDDLPSAMTVMAEGARILTNADGGAVDLVDGGELVCTARSGTAVQQIGARLRQDSSLAGLVVHTVGPALCNDTATDPRVDKSATSVRGVRSLVIVPLSVDGQVIGVLKVVSGRPQAFADRDVANLQILVQTLSTSVKRHRMAAQLQASESQYRMLFAQNPQPMWVYETGSLKLLAVNQAMASAYGYSEQELLAMNLRDLWFEDDPARAALLHQHPPEQWVHSVIRRHRRKDGSAIDVEVSVSPTVFDGAIGRMVLAVDVTHRLRAERDLARVSRAQQMLSACNEALIRATSQEALLQDICRITLDIGGYLGAWVGFARDNAEKSIERIAFAGAMATDDPGEMPSWSEATVRGRGPAGRTIRAGKAVIVPDIEREDDALLPRKTKLRDIGVRSTISLPLSDARRTFGLLFLFGGEVIQVSEDEVKLLQELANDLAFGIGNLRAQQEAERDTQIRIDILSIQREVAALEADLPDVMTVMVERACALIQGDGGTINLVEGDALVCRASTGMLGRGLGTRLGLDNSLTGLAARTGTALVCDDAYTDPRVDQAVVRAMGARSLVLIPLTVDGAVIAVMTLSSSRPEAFAARDVDNLKILVETLGATIKRHRISAQLQASESQYHLMFAQSPQPMWVHDTVSLKLLAVNQAMVEHYGYSEQQLLAMTVPALGGDDQFDRLPENDALADQGLFHDRWRHRKQDGTSIDVDISSSPIVFDGMAGRLVLVSDVTARLKAEHDLARISRAQQMLSACNEALIRATSQDALLQEICRITVDIGGYLGAWVGFARDNAAKSIDPVAASGAVPGYLRELQFSWSDAVPLGHAPTGRTIRTGQVEIVEDIELDVTLGPWIDLVRAAGIHSMISLPLCNAQRTFGLLFLYADEVIQVGTDEIKLLQELANDLAFGIGNLRAQEEQRRVQAAVLKVAAAVSASSGLAFFVQLAHNMAEALGAHAAFVTRLLPGEPPRARTLAAVLDGQTLDNFEYALAGHPGRELIAHSHWVVSDSVAERYPQGVPVIARLQAQAYVGQRLDDIDGNPVGQISVLFREPLEQKDFVLSTLQIFAARVAAEMQRQRADAHIRDQAALLDKAQDAIIVRGMDHLAQFWNHGAERLYGWSAAEALGRSIVDLLYPDTAVFHEAMRQLMLSGSWSGEVLQRRKDGSMLSVEARWTLVRDDTGQPQSILAINTDITQRKAAEREIQRLAFYDPLTQLPNRLLLMDRLQQALSACERSGSSGALLFIDLDNFKTLNDTMGHDKGDMLLQLVAERLTASVRQIDTVARFGGDEFVVMLENLSHNDTEAAVMARTIGEKVLAALAEPYLLAGYEHRTSSSIGVAPFGAHHEGVGELLKQADLAMYQAKTAGRNAMRFFDPAMQAIVNARALMETEMRLALTQQTYALHYQPQYEAGQVIGVEALLRWHHPRRGPVSPAEFIPLAEETGIILSLGQWVLRTACTQLRTWADASHTAHLTMAVNVSARQFRSPDFVDQVAQVLRSTGVIPGRLKLELTESLLVDDLDLTITKMTALKNLGVNFSLDDFGTGYSSLSYLKRLPLDQLKIDQSFVRDILTDGNDAAIVRTIIALGQSLGLSVIAEGVETAAQRDYLAAHGCLTCQGYFFSRPLPIEALQALLQAG